jgi:hypothetical protein
VMGGGEDGQTQFNCADLVIRTHKLKTCKRAILDDKRFITLTVHGVNRD